MYRPACPGGTSFIDKTLIHISKALMVTYTTMRQSVVLCEGLF